jgi:hypothetical protein
MFIDNVPDSESLQGCLTLRQNNGKLRAIQNRHMDTDLMDCNAV